MKITKLTHMHATC